MNPGWELVGLLTREAANHSRWSRGLRYVACFYLGHRPAPSVRHKSMALDACTRCFRIVEALAVPQRTDEEV